MLGIISSIIFLFAVVLLGRETEAATGGGLFFAVCALVVLGFSIFLSFRYICTVVVGSFVQMIMVKMGLFL